MEGPELLMATAPADNDAPVGRALLATFCEEAGQAKLKPITRRPIARMLALGEAEAQGALEEPLALPWLLACSETATRLPKRFEKTVLNKSAFIN
jgi:hypothetical protein